MDPKVGVVGFAFGLRDEEPNPSNKALAKKVDEAVRYVNFYDSMPITVTQWEITKALEEQFDIAIEHSVELRTDGTYLDSKGVWAEAKEVFEREHVTQIIIIAQPFLHLPSLKRMVKQDSFEVLEFDMGEIPFDNSLLNTQRWTRSKFALAAYAAKTLIPGAKHGHDGMQNATN